VTFPRGFFDIGSDANWREYGGMWAKHLGGTRFDVVHIEVAQERGYIVETATLDVADCRQSDLNTCGWNMNLDGSIYLGQGDPDITGDEAMLYKLDALIATWGVGHQGSEFTTMNAYKALRRLGVRV
jgi:hypothetical protein